jgi:AcrR family transcriptional regulator
MAVSHKKVTALMETARELFWKHGLKRVSVEEICEKAGVSKMTFYRHFDNKTDLAKAVYSKVAEESRQQFKAIFTDASTTSAEKLELMVKLKLDGTHEISREFLNDFYSSPEEGMAEFVINLSTRIWNEMVTDFTNAQEEGWFRKDFKPEAFFIMSQKVSELVNDGNFQQLFSTPQEMIMEITRIFTYGLMPYNKTTI